MGKLDETLQRIGKLDAEAMAAAAERQDRLSKPKGALGVLEIISIKVAGILGEPIPEPGAKTVIVMAADHGVVEEGVSLYPAEVTAQMVHNFLSGGAAINVLSRHVGANVTVVDVGVASDLAGEGLVVKKIAPGTANMALGPAMSREQAVAAIEAGIEVAEAEISHGARFLATGDMGIGNTTAASAITACLSGLDPLEVTGRGTGIDDAGLDLKRRVISEALRVNCPDKNDALDVLAKVGGLEIAGIAGVILAAAAAKCPVVIDGFISAAGALVAAGLHEGAPAFMIASHLSVERGHGVILERLGLCPIIHAEMRLGEGTGAALAFSFIDAALKVLREMATFDEAGVSGPEDALEKTQC
ncbi:MAG: nicotinate-nucleotide--dimethylbenzimidazole phosphoribosyltransferase [Candidatus Solincola sediminis]|uniref:Nicotinate-nucleotide--dimethylbenzimidazole phosphoribosyltransferase n=1 Tax=Candidatus Solincola sediminis TaxID=1797199 RepID=A0A1F2WQ31_9ACTN|nr:MAG: nicotinate-nucleotide--dimethylbenzimidazole phosphoribosyltransferase [Candidatus Solincola sediminis]OFW61497.1 MAG: nicotinate-nucleotide--dimethylbenzimidazole phosphoribosyltransferase [Candidatus Solincola sediminis]